MQLQICKPVGWESQLATPKWHRMLILTTTSISLEFDKLMTLHTCKQLNFNLLLRIWECPLRMVLFWSRIFKGISKCTVRIFLCQVVTLMVQEFSLTSVLLLKKQVGWIYVFDIRTQVSAPPNEI